MTALDLRQPASLAAALEVSLRAWAIRRGGSQAEVAEVVRGATEVAKAIAADLAERVRPGQVRNGVLQDLSSPMLAMEICDQLLVKAYGESRCYIARGANDRLRVMADRIASETMAAWPRDAISV